MKSTLSPQLKLLVVMLMLSKVGLSEMHAEWLLRNPPDFVNTVSAIAQAGENHWIAVGEAGMIRVSDNGSGGSNTWTPVSSGTKDWLRAAYWTNGLWVVVGDHGTIVTSRDRQKWAVQQTGTTANLVGVSYGNGEWIAVGDQGTLLRSANGLDWQLTPIAGITLDLTTIANNSSFWVVGSVNGIIFTSPDSRNWRPRTLPTKETFTSIQYGGALWVAAAGRALFSSKDGQNWTVGIRAPEIVTALYYNTVSWCAVGLNGLVLMSNDGKVWAAPKYRLSDSSKPPPTPPSHDFYAVNYTSGIWAFAGAHGGMWLWMVSGSQATVRPAADSEATGRSLRSAFQTIVGQNTSWSIIGELGTCVSQTGPATGPWGLQVHGVLARSGNPQKITSAAAGPTRWICVGPEGRLFESKDQGLRWTENNDLGTRQNLTDVRFGNGLWVVVGERGTVRWWKESASPLHAWTAALTPASERATSFFGVAYGGGRWIAVGDLGTVLVSVDGIHWTKSSQLMRDGRLTSIHHNGVKWVTVGEDGNIWTSLDGTEWQKAIVPSRAALQHVAFGNGQWVAVGDHGVLLVSEDADSWFLVRVPTNVRLKCAESLDGDWVLAGEGGLGLVWAGRLIPSGGLQITARASGLRFYWQSDGSQTALEAAPRPDGPWHAVSGQPIRLLSGWQLDLPLPLPKFGFFRVKRP